MVNEIEPSCESGTAAAGCIQHREGNHRRACPRCRSDTFVILTARPASRLEAVGATCAPMIDASKSISPCGMWQVAHCVVVELRTARVIDAGSEIHVVVAGPAGGARRIGQIRGRLRRARSLRVAGFATPRIAGIGRENDFRIVKRSDACWSLE